MRVVTRYYCEVCDSSYDTPERALECEARGLAFDYPIGMIYGNHEQGAFYKNITFATAQGLRADGHSDLRSSWACRDNEYGDSLGKSTCAGSIFNVGQYSGKLNFEHPTFKRMVAYLKSQNIPITIWNGKEAVPYEE